MELQSFLPQSSRAPLQRTSPQTVHVRTPPLPAENRYDHGSNLRISRSYPAWCNHAPDESPTSPPPFPNSRIGFSPNSGYSSESVLPAHFQEPSVHRSSSHSAG